MKLYLRNNIFPLSVTLITIIPMIFVGFVYPESKYISKDNILPLAVFFRIVFIISLVIIGLREFFRTNRNFSSLFTLRNILQLSIVIALIFSITKDRIAYYAAGIFVFCAFVYFLQNRKIYAFNMVYVFLILYALMQIIGSFFNDSPFRFPEKIYSFLIFPFAFCLFSFEKQTYLRILKIVFRVIFIYVCITLVFWIFNVRVYDASIVEWITKKLYFDPLLTAFNLVGYWSFYDHPSYIFLVLLATHVAGFYLFFKKNRTANITLTEIIVYSVAIIALGFAYESRVGVVATILVILVSLFYYMKLKSSFVKLSVLVLVIFGGSVLVFQSDRFAAMRNDNIRKIDYILAVNYIKDNFWWGTGTGKQKEALEYQQEIMKDLPRAHNIKTYVHNQFLGEMVQFGLVGLIVLLVVISGLVYHSFKKRSYLLQLLLFIYILFMLIEEPLYVQPGISRFIVFFAIFVAISETETERKYLDLRQWFSKSKSA